MNPPSITATRPWLLISDVDDTLTGDAAGLIALDAAIAANRDRIWFSLNSSRPAPSVLRTLREVFPETMVPDAIITALGTEISLGGKPLEGWQEKFAHWPQPEIHALLLSLGHRPHDDEFQTPHKVSFAVEGAEAQNEARNALSRAGLPCQIIASGTDDFDIIPVEAGKGAASLFLAQTLGVPPGGIVAAGDSGNDLDLFRIAGSAIAVANARQELLAKMPSQTSYHAMRSHAAGVLEGLVHFGVID